MAIPAQARRPNYERELANRGASDAPDPTFLQGVAASFDRAREDIPGVDEQILERRYAPLITSLIQAGGPQSASDYLTPTGSFDREAIWQGVAQVRSKNPGALADFPASKDAYEKQIWEDFHRQQGERAGVVSRTGWVPFLAGTFAGGLTDPINLATMAATGGASSGVRSIGQTVLREGIINGGTELAEQPLVAQQRAQRGETLSLSEAAANVGMAGALGGAVGGAIHVAPHVIQRVRGIPDTHLPDAAETAIGRENMTTDERAAADVLRRESAIDASSPYAPTGAGDAAHRDQLSAAIRAVLGDDPAPTTRGRLLAGTAGAGRGAATMPRPALIAGDAASVDRIFEQLIGQESGARAGIPGQQTPYGVAHGMTQVLDATGAKMAEKLGVPWQPELMRSKTPEGAAYQRQIGRAYFDEGLQKYGGDIRQALMYYHGGPNERLWGKKTHAYADAILSKSGGGNPTVDVAALGGGDDELAALRQRVTDLQSQGEALDGQVRASDAAPTIGDTIAEAGRPVVDPQLADPYAIPPMTAMQVPASRVTVDAGLMQFKEGGDANGVTDRLQGVEDWNPLLADRQILWERKDGALIVADGHQRVGLARRIGEKTGRDIPLDVIVLREADGVTAGHARMLAAVKNIAEGTGSAIDAAKVIREGGPGVLAHLPPRSALVRDGAALAHLSPDAFGAVVNGVVKPEQGAAIGRMLPDDPASHATMVDLLAKTKPANRTQAESIIRDAIAAGFTDGEQTDMFGTIDTRANLFLERAKVLDGALGQLRKLKNVFKVAGREADTLETGGVGTIDATRAAQEATHNATAIELVERLASTHGPIKDAVDRAARALADGGKPGAVIDRLVKDIRGIDLRDALMVRDRADAADAARSAQGPAEPAPALIDDQTLGLFDDPHGAPSALVRESLEHDFRASLVAGAQVDATDAGRARYQDSIADLWRMSPDELEAVFARAEAGERAALREAATKSGLEMEPGLARVVEHGSIERAAERLSAALDKHFASEIPADIERLVAPRWEDHQAGDLPNSDDLARLQKAYGAISPEDSEHSIASEIGWALRSINPGDLEAVASGKGTIDAQAALVTTREGYRVLRERGVSSADMPRILHDAMVANGVSRAHADELTGRVMEMMRDAAPPARPATVATALPSPAKALEFRASEDRHGFRFEEEGGIAKRADVVKQIDAEDSAIKNVRDCL